MEQHILVGVDGGGTKTRVLARRSDNSRILFDRQFPGSNYHSIGKTGLTSVLAEIVSALTIAFGPALDRSVFVLGMAGIDRPQDAASYESVLSEIGCPGKQVVCNDADIALVGAHGGDPGALLLCGTGSIAIGRTADHRVIRSGGWGALVSDEGSGYRLGCEAISAALRAYDRSGPSTVLQTAVRDTLKLRSLPDILDVLYLSGDGLPVRQIASLAPLVTENCARDPVCHDIVTRQVNALCDLLVPIREAIGLPTLDLALGGGLLLNAEPYRNAFVETLALRMPSVRIVPPQDDAPHGALIMAAQILEKEGAL